jgi:hypothetical protein
MIQIHLCLVAVLAFAPDRPNQDLEEAALHCRMTNQPQPFLQNILRNHFHNQVDLGKDDDPKRKHVRSWLFQSSAKFQ